MLPCYGLTMRRAALLVVASCALAACAEGEKDVPFASSDAAIDAPRDTGVMVDTALEETCVPADGATCTVFPQCGCTSSQNCNVTSATGATSCVAAGTDGLHETCTAGGDCQRGMQCVAGLCVPFCATDADCPMPGARCKTAQEAAPGGTSMEVPGLKICLAQCDVQAPAAVCGPNTTCFFPFPGDDTTECAAAGTSTVKGGCTSNRYACAPGYYCSNGIDCFKWCRVGMSDCFAGQTCTSLTPKAMKGTVEYGVCAY